MALTGNIEGVGTSDEETWLLVTLDLPIGREALRLLRPVLDLHDEVALLLGHDGLSDGSFALWGRGHTVEVIQEGCAVREWEEQAALVRHISHLLRVGNLLLLRHRLRQVSNLKVGIASGRHNQSWLTSEEALTSGALGADSWVNRPLTILSVLDLNRLSCGFPHDSLEGKFLSLRALMSDALAHHCEVNGLATLHLAHDLL